MATKWTEEAIRAEMARLDKKTGLHGASLPIKFGNARSAIGMYYPDNGGSFRFSNYYYQDPDWCEEEALDTIRHEYAHYMDHQLYNGSGHGLSWKRCCVIVGALPTRVYKVERAQYYRRKHEEDAKRSEHYDTYRVGSRLEHPQYGVGVITEITGRTGNRIVSVKFPTVGVKKLGLDWIDKHCRRR